MLGYFSEYNAHYLTVLFVFTTVAFVIPIFFTPMNWGRMLLWNIPDDTDLAVYFGRCLGSFALVLEIMVLRALFTGAGLSFVCDFLILVFVLMVIVHVYGAIKGIQPITETLEIGFWAGLIVAGVLFYPTTTFIL